MTNTELRSMEYQQRTQGSPPMLPNIAFIGKAGAGKTTASMYLTREFGYASVSFAWPLKKVASELWGHDAATDRDKLQKLGVAVRQIEPDTWVNLAIENIKYVRAAMGGVPVVIDDLRFPNEYWALRDEGFVIVRVLAEEVDRIPRLQASGKWQSHEQLSHISETAIDDLPADHNITNTVTKDQFYSTINFVINRELKRS